MAALNRIDGTVESAPKANPYTEGYLDGLEDGYANADRGSNALGLALLIFAASIVWGVVGFAIGLSF